MNADWNDGFKSAELDAIATLARWMIANSFATGHGDTMADMLRELKWQVDEARADVTTLWAAIEDREPILTAQIARGEAAHKRLAVWVGQANEWKARAEAAEAQAAKLKEALQAIAHNADGASDLPLFRVQCRDFARRALGEGK
jgi:hypothetical protein